MCRPGYIEQLLQLFNGATWDGDLLAKSHRDALIKAGLAERAHGYNIITRKGVQYLLDLGLIHP